MIDRHERANTVELAVLALLRAIREDITPQLANTLKQAEEFKIAGDSVTFTLHGLYSAVLLMSEEESARQFSNGTAAKTLLSDELTGCTPEFAAASEFQDCRALGFDAFRAELFASRVNEKLASEGLTVSIARSTGKAHSNWYQLVALG